jgi:hypothetical protein
MDAMFSCYRVYVMMGVDSKLRFTSVHVPMH